MNALFTLAVLLAVEPEPRLRIEAEPKSTAVKVVAQFPDDLVASIPERKLTQEEGERWLKFTLLSQGDSAILGSYERSGNTLTFTPRFALAHGERYRATLTVGEKRLQLEHRAPPKPPTTPAVVQAVYPTAEELPANLLKFYLHFSKPMRESKDIFDHIEVRDAEGKPVEDPWRRTELWNDDGTRLTLWIHPGRTKKGVNLNAEFGPVLEPKRRYTLVIGAKVLDAEGQPLEREFAKSFRTGEAVRLPIELKDWTVKAPSDSTKEPLEVKLPRPLDRALLDRFVTVTNADKKTVAGRIEVGKDERSWSFHPEQPWQAGTFHIIADERLEDLAGNTLLAPFDLDRRLPTVPNPQRTILFTVGQ